MLSDTHHLPYTYDMLHLYGSICYEWAGCWPLRVSVVPDLKSFERSGEVSEVFHPTVFT